MKGMAIGVKERKVKVGIKWGMEVEMNR